jgi:hypothetical protein
MINGRFQAFAVALAWVITAWAQAPVPKFIVGTIEGFKAEAGEIQVKPDSGDAVAVKLSASTQVQRVPAGEKDLKKAEPIQIGDVASGDRVLVSLMPGAFEARRIVVMSSSDIAKKKEADTQDWNKRGVAGIVASKNGNEIALRKRSMQGEIKLTVTAAENTQFRRYAPDSVKFADAKKASLADIAVGDQLRARGQKSEDGLKVAAEEVVFGTFLTKAGPILAVNVEAKEITIKDMATSKPLTVKVTDDSQLKAMPNMAGMTPPGPGGPAAAGAPRPAGSGPDLAQMLERMPPGKLEDLKPGGMIIVSSTKGASSDQVTAIMLVANADMLIKMASMSAAGGAAGARGGAGAGPSMATPGMGGGFGGLSIPGMMP